MIELVDFSKKYRKSDSPVVQNINLKAESGMVTALLGLNGQGKTTIIKAVCGIHYASSGKVYVSSANEKFDLSENPDPAKKHLGYMPETATLPENLTVKEFLHFARKIYAPDSGESGAVQSVIKACELEDVQDKKIKALSKGFRQRVNLAQALVHSPENIILDEPVNGLDPAQIIQFRKIIKKIAEDKTVLLSTHLMQEVSALCNRLYILNGSTIAFSGTKSELLEKTHRNTLEEAFLALTEKQTEEASL